MKKRLMAMMLAVALVASMCTPAFAASPSKNGVELKSGAEDDLIYVSIGDSTTNGYGLTGYELSGDTLVEASRETYEWVLKNYSPYYDSESCPDDGQDHFFSDGYQRKPGDGDADYYYYTHNAGVANVNGLLMQTPGAYPALFRDYLETTTDKDVNLIQLATSGIRTDDVWYLISLIDKDPSVYFMDGDDRNLSSEQYVIQNFTGATDNLPFEWSYVYDKHLWHYDDDRFGAYKALDGKTYYGSGATTALAIDRMAELYEKSVKTADVISINLGSNNFSTFVWGNYLKEIIKSMMSGDPDHPVEENENVELEKIKALADPQLIAMADVINREIEEMVENDLLKMLPDMPEKLGDYESEWYIQTLARETAKRTTYTFLTYAYCNEQIIKWIGEVNPNADIILTNMTNFLEGFKIVNGDEIIDADSLMAYALEAANQYLANEIAEMKANGTVQNDIVYADNGTSVNVLVENFPEYVATNFKGAEVFLSRTIKAMSWHATEAYLPDDGRDLPFFVNESWGDGPALTNAHLTAMADAIKNGTEYAYDNENYGYAAAFVYGLINSISRAVQEKGVDAKFFQSLLTMEYQDEMESFRQSLKKQLEDEVGITTSDATQTNLSIAEYAKIAKIVEDAVCTNEYAYSYLYLQVFYDIGDGIACHPSEAGYRTMANAMIEAYKENTPAEDGAGVVGTMGKLQTELKKLGVLTDAEAEAIVAKVFDALADFELTEREIKDLALNIYEILTNPAVEVLSLFAAEPSLSAVDKVAVIKTVYGVLKADGMLDAYPVLDPIVDIYNDVANASPAAAVTVFETIFYGVLENDEITEEVQNEIVSGVYDAVMNSDEISPEAKLVIVEKAAELLANSELGAATGLPLDKLSVIKKLRQALADYFTPAQLGEIIDDISKLVTDGFLTELEKAQLADKLHNSLMGRDDLSAEDKAEIVMIVYGVLEDEGLIDYAVAGVLAYAYLETKSNGYIGAAADGLVIAQDAIEIAKDYVNANVPAEYEAIKDLMIEELNNTADTLAELENLLRAEPTDIDSVIADMMALEENLWEHLDTLKELGLAAGIEIDPYLIDLNNAVIEFNGVVEDVIDEAYAIISTVKEFPAAYAEWVESVGAAVDTVNSELGVLVRQYLTDVPADSLAILAVYGDEAVAKLVVEAVAAYGDVADVIAELAYVLYAYGEDIYEAVEANDEVERLIEAIKTQLAKAEKLIKEIEEAPFTNAYEAYVADKEAALDAVYAELTIHYNELSKVLFSAIEDVDPIAAEALSDALEALTETLSIACDSADGYLGWLCGHAEAMGAELLTALLDNTWEFLMSACPIVDEMIWALLAEIDKAILEFLPIADQWMYDWLYNNPEKVIAFFTEYAEEIEWLMEEYGVEAVMIVAYVAYTYGPDMLDYVINNPEEALEQFVAWYNKYGYRVWPMIDVYLEELGVYDKLEEDFNAALEEIEDALKELGIEIQDHVQDKIDEIYAMIEGEIEATKAEIEKAIDELIAMIEEMLYDATHAEYTVTPDSYYVAIDKMYGEGEDYADKLAAELGVAYSEINELDADEIAKADLITVRYNNEPMIGAMIEDAKDYKKVEAKDWSVYVGEEGVEYVQQALAEVEAMLAEQNMGTLADMVMVAIESYAYEYAGYLIGYIKDLETIAAINPDALIISVGMNNALADVVLTLGEDEIALGEYIQYVVDAANLEAFAYALVTGNAIYVDAPAVETEFDADEATEAMDFILTLIDEEAREVLLATDAGHEYIKEQILGALNVTVEGINGLLGDANSDGVVDYIDAIFVLEYDAKLRTANELALALCDVDGSGDVDYVDAIIILEYDAKIISKFPVAA